MWCALDTLTESEATQICLLRDTYWQAREFGNYPLADALRKGVEAAGFMPPKYERWSPVFESSNNRLARVTARKQKKKQND